MKVFSYFIVFSCFLYFVADLKGQTSRLRVNFEETVLKNGLRVVTVEDRGIPVITLAVTYDVGSRDERRGRSGFAHLFEHMMFKGSENVGEGEHYTLVFTNGGSMNGTTNPDRTNYYDTLPSNQLEMALFIEADKMRSLEITKENLDNQRSAVQEERRIIIDNAAYGPSNERHLSMIYENPGYRNTVLGSMEDLNAASVEDVQAFFKTYYAPNNAVLTLVGDFEKTAALAVIRKHFERIPAQPAPLAPDASEPPRAIEHRATLEDPRARAARVNIAYKAAAGNTADYYALHLLSTVLTVGQSSRLFRKLVKETSLATGVSGYMDERRGLGALYVSANVAPDTGPDDAEATIYDEIEAIKRSGISEEELRKAKNTARRIYINGLRSSMSRATQIGDYAIYYNDPNLINTHLDKVEAVTTEDVRRAAKKYLVEERRATVITVPKKV